MMDAPLPPSGINNPAPEAQELQSTWEVVTNAFRYVLGKARLITIPQEMVSSKVTHKDEDFSLTCECWWSPIDTSIYMRKCAVSEGAVNILRDEKEILRAAQGPNIVPLIESGDDSILMPHAGQTLYYKLEQQDEGMSHPDFRVYGSQLINGLTHLHNSRIWHLDLKPANVLIDEEGRLSIIDFGLAQYVGPAENAEVCTEGYKPPEMFYRGKKEVSKKTDVFSAGVILFEMLTNERLFPEALDTQTMEKQHLYYEYLNNRLKAVDRIDSGYARLLKSMLAWNPRHRPTASQVLGDFMRF
ncbi:protein kinase domain-containing protein [Endozoicomonas arenosclerae]|uniref:protein kinase domain-containing protein n=1 Tax=Endozoicomonas arenosclerae TaxID=1633495 RepID=UPI000781433C|nr:protein kinase [Endozoicomonas arenosclerae]